MNNVSYNSPSARYSRKVTKKETEIFGLFTFWYPHRVKVFHTLTLGLNGWGVLLPQPRNEIVSNEVANVKNKFFVLCFFNSHCLSWFSASSRTRLVRRAGGGRKEPATKTRVKKAHRLSLAEANGKPKKRKSHFKLSGSGRLKFLLFR